MTKTEVFRFRCTPDDRREIFRLAQAQQCRASEAIRQAVKAALQSTNQPQAHPPQGNQSH